MARRISSMQAGEAVTLRFHTRSGHFDEAAVFVGLSEDGETATFRSASDNKSDDDTYDWDAYRFQGRWCYGSSAQRLSVV